MSFGCLAAAPADAPAGSTGLCKDGTYYNGAEKKGACKGHKGVKDWWGAADASTSKMDAKSDMKADTAKAAAAPAPAATKTASKSDNKPAAQAAPGGGPGMVWANDNTKVYHCNGDKWYGKTKKGEYMSESDAKSKGFKPDHGKACS